ncbi:hypothetical protein Tco_0050405, partial [Tanacetum coccineum]
AVARNSSSMGSGSGPARDSCTFPESDPAWSFVRTDVPTPDVTVDEATSPCSLSPLGAAASVPLSVHSGPLSLMYHLQVEKRVQLSNHEVLDHA